MVCGSGAALGEATPGMGLERDKLIRVALLVCGGVVCRGVARAEKWGEVQLLGQTGSRRGRCVYGWVCRHI